VSSAFDLLTWLREQCAEYDFDVRGVFRRASPYSTWPLSAADPNELEERLISGGHLLPLPKEPAALANVLEVSIVNFILDRLARVDGAEVQRGRERGYPDLEVGGPAFGGGYYAVDVKAARRSDDGRPETQSRITLYTGNTYFRWPDLHWPGTFRPFKDYSGHIDMVLIYDLNVHTAARVEHLEVLIHEPWRIASKRRSSDTREYIGAVQKLDDLREGRGEFESPQEFYKYWRTYHFRISKGVQKRLDKLIREQQEEIARLRQGQEER
jgi:hypothetical protein